MNTNNRPRTLLRNLHTVMAGTGSGQERLDRVVKEIAKSMEAEVCSVYLLNSEGVLELFATEGLKKAAVHKTHLKVGEGLVGYVAKIGLPMNIAQASKHPQFVYLPEIGEEIYNSFMAVPLTP